MTSSASQAVARAMARELAVDAIKDGKTVMVGVNPSSPSRDSEESAQSSSVGADAAPAGGSPRSSEGKGHGDASVCSDSGYCSSNEGSPTMAGAAQRSGQPRLRHRPARVQRCGTDSPTTPPAEGASVVAEDTDAAPPPDEFNEDGSVKHLFQRVYRARAKGDAATKGAACAPCSTVAQVPSFTQPSSSAAAAGAGVAGADGDGDGAENMPVTPLHLTSSAGVDASSSSSVGGHHLSLTEGRTFMKQSNSRREERFYALIGPSQRHLVRHAIARWRRTLRAGDGGSNNNNNNNDSASSSRSGSTEDDETLCTEEPGSAAAAAMEEARETAAATWWTLRERTYTRSKITAYEVQRMALSAPKTQAVVGSESTAASTPPPAAAVYTVELDSSSDSTGAAAAPGGRIGVALPPDNVYAASKDRALRLLAPFIPRFLGLRQVRMNGLVPVVVTATHAGGGGGAADDAVTPVNAVPCPVDADGSDAPPRASGGGAGPQPPLCQMVALEDVCHGFTRPCVLDMKMGQRQYGMHPTPEKKKKKEYRCQISTSGTYGIRLAGFKRWSEEEQRYSVKSKRQCRGLTLHEVKQELSAFFNSSRALERKFSEQVEELRVAFSQQTVFQFFTSSLLFVYDAAQPLATCRIVMVDFAFTYERKELAQGGDPGAVFEYDLGYIKALDTLLSLLA